LTRIADKVALIVDDGRKVERGVARNTGDKASALNIVRGEGLVTYEAKQSRMPSRPPPERQLEIAGPAMGGTGRTAELDIGM
jgi:hypothetical protein